MMCYRGSSEIGGGFRMVLMAFFLPACMRAREFGEF